MNLIATKGKNRDIEFWRFVFTVFIVLFHMQVSCGREPNFLLTGTYAVEFFFLLSGYFLAVSMQRKYDPGKPAGPQVWAFAWHRLKRFVPYCWLFLFLSGTYRAYLFRMSGYTQEQLAQYIKNLWPELWLLNGVVTVENPANGATWYISSLLIVSIAYYLLFIVSKKCRLPGITFPLVISVPIYWIAYWNNNWFLDGKILRGFCCVGLGMILCEAVNAGKHRAEKCPPWFWQILQVVSIASLVWVYCVRQEDKFTDAFVVPLCTLFLFTVLGVNTPLNRMLDNRISGVLGEISFVMYMSHLFLLTRMLWQPHLNLYGNIVLAYTMVTVIVFAFSLVVCYIPKFIGFILKRTEEQPIAAGRLVYPDVLRAFATVLVIVLHVCGGILSALTPDMWQFKWVVSADTVAHCALPLFLMLSGMFLLAPEKQVPLSAIFKKYITRLVIAYIGWSAVYAVFMAVFNETLFSEGLRGLWNMFFNGHYHLWFIPMMIGVYLTTPFFRGITEKKDENLLHYTMAVLVLFLVVTPRLASIAPNAHNILTRINPSWFGMYATYFFAGYYFSRIKVTQFGKYVWLGVLAASGVWFVRSVYFGSTALGALDESRWNPNQIPMVVYTVSVFMAFRNFGDIVIRFPKLIRFVKKLSEVSFVVYLCHDLFIKSLAYMGINVLTWHPAISLPVLIIAILISSMILSEVLLEVKKSAKRQIKR